MTDIKTTSDELCPGLYDQLVTKAMAAQIAEMPSRSEEHTLNSSHAA